MAADAALTPHECATTIPGSRPLRKRMSIPSLSIATLLADLEEVAHGAGYEAPRAVSEWLVAALLQCGRLDLHVRRHELLADAQMQTYQEYRNRLRRHEPVQYIVGETEFLGMRILCDSRALIPRPETEQWVGRVLKEVPPPAVVVDVGTGTGCIACAMALAWPSTRVLAVDVDPSALSLAQDNARLLGGAALGIEWREAGLLNGMADHCLDLVLANLPYIDTRDCASLPPEVALHEPSMALDGGVGGLCLVEELARQSMRRLRRNGRIYMEIGAGQGDAAMALMKRAGYEGVHVEPDWAGRDRVVSGVKP